MNHLSNRIIKKNKKEVLSEVEKEPVWMWCLVHNEWDRLMGTRDDGRPLCARDFQPNIKVQEGRV